MTKAVRAILQALSYGNIEVESARRLADLKKLDPMRIFLKKLDTEIYNGSYKVPVRLYFPDEKAAVSEKATVSERATVDKKADVSEKVAVSGNGAVSGEENRDPGVILFFHGGGWTTESVETYDRVCSRMAQSTGRFVLSAEYRLAPEHRFPDGFEDCYAVAAALFGGKILPGLDPRRITVMGDSAGGNLAAAVCMKARDTGDFSPARQILIYPALYNCYTEDSPYESVRTNGTGYLLTSVKMEDYVKLYARTEEDRLDPYFAPLLAEDFSGLPDTLILTAEFDPLRDEGEDYGRKLREAGCRVRVERIEGALHGYFALGIQQFYVQESFRHINRFLSVEQALL